jgi:hypothetical protein
MSLRLLAAAIVTAGLLTAPASAEIIFSDDFSYPDGNLTDTANWAAHSGAGAKAIQVAGGEITLEQSAGSGEDVSRLLGRTMSAGEIFRFSFDITVNGTGPANTTYFAHFKDDGTGFNARTFVAAPSAGGDFTFGIGETSGSTPDSLFSTDFSYGTTYRLFAQYDYDAGLSTMWIDDPSTTISSTSVDAMQGMSAMAFRQSTGNTTMVIDNLVVESISAVPEPGSFAVLGLAAAGLVVRRRRKLALAA